VAKGKDEIRDEIEETRRQMGDTIEALAYKADVKSRAKESLHGATEDGKRALRDVRHRIFDGGSPDTQADYGYQSGSLVGEEDGEEEGENLTPVYVVAGGVVLGGLLLLFSR